MILQPARALRSRAQTARRVWIPAPLGGLNAQDPWSEMSEQYALVLNNCFPRTDSLRVRNGYTSWATGIGGAVRSLMEYSGVGTNKFFAAKTSAIYEITVSGPVGAAAVSGLISGDWQSSMMATSGGNFLVIANGGDSVRSFDGTTWATPAITGVASSTLVHLFAHKRRLWFIERGTLNTWYLPVDSIAGAATKIDLGPVFYLGGYLVAGGSMTRDGGAGPDDLACFVTSRGEVAVYQGTDPASASTWAIVGVFQIPPPIGRRCLQKLGGDLSVLTEGGLVSLMTMFALDRSAQDRAAITGKINRLFIEDSSLYRTNFGWQFISYPRGNMIVVNVPGTSSKWQYVMNATNGAWCKFSHPSRCWSLYDEALYFGDDSGTVWKADSGAKDAGTTLIDAEIQTAFNYLGSRVTRKHIQMIRPLIVSTLNTTMQIGMNTDLALNGDLSDPFVSSGLTTNWVMRNSSNIGDSVGATMKVRSVDSGGVAQAVDVHGFHLIFKDMGGHIL